MNWKVRVSGTPRVAYVEDRVSPKSPMKEINLFGSKIILNKGKGKKSSLHQKITESSQKIKNFSRIDTRFYLLERSLSPFFQSMQQPNSPSFAYHNKTLRSCKSTQRNSPSPKASQSRVRSMKDRVNALFIRHCY
jgi:hypothetical protein